MTVALVGTIGAATAASVSPAPAWGTGSTRQKGNLLVCWIAQWGGNAQPTLTSGSFFWTSAEGSIENISSSGIARTDIFYLIAQGGDVAPTIASGAFVEVAQLAEFTGVANPPTPQQVAGNGFTATPGVITAAAADSQVGSLIVVSAALQYSTAATKTTTHTLNNGSLTVNSNDATSTVNHYSFGYSISTSNAVADSDSISYTTTKNTAMAAALASFPPAVLLSSQLHHHSPNPSHSRPRQSRARFMVAFPKLWTPKLWLPETA
jgi:hypothetical protein